MFVNHHQNASVIFLLQEIKNASFSIDRHACISFFCFPIQGGLSFCVCSPRLLYDHTHNNHCMMFLYLFLWSLTHSLYVRVGVYIHGNPLYSIIIMFRFYYSFLYSPRPCSFYSLDSSIIHHKHQRGEWHATTKQQMTNKRCDILRCRYFVFVYLMLRMIVMIMKIFK